MPNSNNRHTRLLGPIKLPTRLALLLLASWISLPVWALSADMEADRLLLATRKYLAESNYDKATQALNQMQQLKTELPNEYYFFRGQLSWHDHQAAAARSALETYVQKAGREGEHYEQALNLLTDIDDTAGTAATASATPKQPEIRWQKNSELADDYVAKLEKLYLKQNPADALVLHINSLLTANPYHSSRIITANERNGVQYRVSLGGKGVLLVQETRYDDAGNANVSLDRREVFGVDPYVRYGCDSQRRACWLYDPQDAYREWLLVGENQADTSDLAKAMTKLILVLQNPG